MGATETELTGPDFKQGLSTNSLKPGERFLGHADGEPVILIREGDKFFAIGAKCTHYSADLNEGLVTDGVIRCPWHHACFNLETGEAKKAPALNPIPTWDLEIVDEVIFVRGQREKKRRLQKINLNEHFVIVGSGAAGHAASEMLRREGFEGSLTVLSCDQDRPYDTPNLSKDYLAGSAPEEWMSLRSADFFKEQNITLRLNSKVVRLDPDKKEIFLSSGEKLRFDKCLIATGGAPFKPDIKGIDQPHVKFLRTFADCKSLIEALSGIRKVVIVGSGFIGLEGAASLKTRGLEVTVIAPQALPLAHVIGEQAGVFLKSVHEKNGVQFRFGKSVASIEKDRVVLSDGTSESADVVLVATGIKPNEELALSAGLNCQNGILANEYLETSKKDIFAAGDVARWLAPRNKQMRVEHWAVAQRQGQAAALNMLGRKHKFTDVPFFWSQQFDVTFAYVGHADHWSKTQVFGSLESRDCAIAFFENDVIEAVLTIGRDQQSLEIEKAFEMQDQARIRQILK